MLALEVPIEQRLLDRHEAGIELQRQERHLGNAFDGHGGLHCLGHLKRPR